MSWIPPHSPDLASSKARSRVVTVFIVRWLTPGHACGSASAGPGLTPRAAGRASSGSTIALLLRHFPGCLELLLEGSAIEQLVDRPVPLVPQARLDGLHARTLA